MEINKGMELLLTLNYLQSKVQKTVDRRLANHGVGYTEFMVMHTLQTEPGGTMRRIDLAESIGMSASGVTRLLNPMEKIGLVKKVSVPRDARVSPISLTVKGKEIYSYALESFASAAEMILKDLDENETASFLTVLMKLR